MSIWSHHVEGVYGVLFFFGSCDIPRAEACTVIKAIEKVNYNNIPGKE